MPQRHSPREMLAQLVSISTVSRDSNLPLIAFVEDYLAGHGVAAHRVPNADGTKTNLWATLGPAAPGGVVLSGHTDVVPVDGQPWTSDPFRLTERDGRLHGRGAADMKGFLAITLSLVPEMLSAGLRRPVHLAMSYDEEIGCLGAPSMIRQMRERIPPPEAVIVGEPTMMQVVTGHKGTVGLNTHVRGYEVHSGLVHTGVPAVMVAARLVTWIADRMEQTRRAAAEKPGEALYEPPYTTLHCGMIEGGTAHNITAKDCRFSTDIRYLPHESGEAYVAEYREVAARLERETRAVRPEAFIDIAERSHAPGCQREADGAAERLARSLTGDNGEHVVAYGTEAGHFQAQAFYTVVCGPGDIAQAHAADEYITLAQLAAGEAFQRRLIAHLAA
ncbi:MAG: acetylornithine deacetylase [Hyphomicrobiales bacterium]